MYWKQHCRQTCPYSEHCLKKHINDKTIELNDIKYCFLTAKRIGLPIYEVYFKEVLQRKQKKD